MPHYFTMHAVLVGLVAGGMVGLLIYLDYADRARVRLVFRIRGGRVIRLTPHEGPIWARLLQRVSVTHWEVEYLDREGLPYKARVAASMRRCIVESDEPVATKPGKGQS